MIYYIPQSLAVFQVLNNHLWLVATILDSTGTKQVHHLGKDCWTALTYILPTEMFLYHYILLHVKNSWNIYILLQTTLHKHTTQFHILGDSI